MTATYEEQLLELLANAGVAFTGPFTALLANAMADAAGGIQNKWVIESRSIERPSQGWTRDHDHLYDTEQDARAAVAESQRSAGLSHASDQRYRIAPIQFLNRDAGDPIEISHRKPVTHQAWIHTTRDGKHVNCQVRIAVVDPEAHDDAPYPEKKLTLLVDTGIPTSHIPHDLTERVDALLAERGWHAIIGWRDQENGDWYTFVQKG